MYKSLLLIVYPKAKEIIATKNKGIIDFTSLKEFLFNSSNSLLF